MLTEISSHLLEIIPQRRGAEVVVEIFDGRHVRFTRPAILTESTEAAIKKHMQGHEDDDGIGWNTGQHSDQKGLPRKLRAPNHS